jgi:hypothetical protein
MIHWTDAALGVARGRVSGYKLIVTLLARCWRPGAHGGLAEHRRANQRLVGRIGWGGAAPG